MESGEWRHGQPDDRRRNDAAADEGRSRASGGWPGAPEPAPDLWPDDESTAWGSTSFSWLQRDGEGDGAGGAIAGGGGGRGGEPVERGRPGPDNGWHRPPAPSDWGQSRHLPPPAPALHQMPVMPALPAPAPPRKPMVGVGQISPAGPMRRTGTDNWSRPEIPRGRPVRDEPISRRRRDRYGDEPAYGPVLGFTAGWYAAPAVFYAIWLVTLNADRQGLIGRQFVASLPWLIGAVVLSLAVATLLRWATIGWRTLTLSFAAAVIGAGVATIAHSLSL